MQAVIMNLVVKISTTFTIFELVRCEDEERNKKRQNHGEFTLRRYTLD